MVYNYIIYNKISHIPSLKIPFINCDNLLRNNVKISMQFQIFKYEIIMNKKNTTYIYHLYIYDM